MYARQLERRGRPLAAFGRIAEGRKVGRELGMNRPNQGRAAGAPTIIKAVSRPGIFERRGRVCGNAGVIRSVMHQPAQRERMK